MSWLEVSDFDHLGVGGEERTAQAQVLAPLDTIAACGQIDVKEELEKRFVAAQNAVTDAINLGADKMETATKNFAAKKAFEDIEAAKKQGRSAFWRCIANSYTSTLRPSPPAKPASSASSSSSQGTHSCYLIPLTKSRLTSSTFSQSDHYLLQQEKDEAHTPSTVI